MHRIADHRRRRAGVHDIDVHVNQLPGLVANQRRASDVTGRFIREHLDEPLGFSKFPRLAITLHLESLDAKAPALLLRLALRETNAAQFRVGKHRVRHNAIGRSRTIAGHLREQNPVVVP